MAPIAVHRSDRAWPFVWATVMNPQFDLITGWCVDPKG
jgi:hypothetical protein